MTRVLLSCVMLLLACVARADAVDAFVSGDFVNLYSGPGRGYPIVQVAIKGEALQLNSRRTDWIQVSFKQQKLWLERKDLVVLQTADKLPFSISDDRLAQFANHSWEAGLMYGDFNGSSYYQLNVAYLFSPYVQTELAIGQANGENADYQLIELSMMLSPFAQWRLSPYLAIGGGMLRINPRTVLVQSPDSNNALASVELGARYYLTRQFIVRGAYRRSVVATDSNDNKETDTWKLGFSVFF